MSGSMRAKWLLVCLTAGCTDWASLYLGCGNAEIEPGEQCDDGNHEDGDGCNASCGVEAAAGARCGDSVVWSGVEDCDDGNQDDTDGCTTGCVSCEPSQNRLYWPESGHCYEYFETPQTWSGARGTCAGRGEYLLSLREVGEADALCQLGLLGNVQKSWLGLGDVVGFDLFQFDSGEPLKRPFWGAGQPQSSDEDAVLQEVSSANACAKSGAYDLTWSSAATNDKDNRLPFFCERAPAVVASTRHAYRVLYPIKSWHVADEQCRALGGHLATIESADEAAFINGITLQLQVWLGGRDTADTSSMAWITGEPFEYEVMATGESLSFEPGDNCLALLADDLWHIRSCASSSMKALCEIE